MNKADPNPMSRFERKPTRGNAIKAMCAHCVGCTYESIEPGFRRLIKTCRSERCPLHRYRPYQGASDGDTDTEDELITDGGAVGVVVASIS